MGRVQIGTREIGPCWARIRGPFSLKKHFSIHGSSLVSSGDPSGALWMGELSSEDSIDGGHRALVAFMSEVLVSVSASPCISNVRLH